MWLVEAADDICYQVMDIEDSHRLKILPTADVQSLLLNFFPAVEQERMRRSMSRLRDPNEQIAYLRSYAIGAMVEECARAFVEHEAEILSGRAEGSLVKMMAPRLCEAYEGCAATAREHIYRSPEVVDIEIAGNRILTYLLSNLTEAVRYPDRNFSQLLFEKIPAQYSIHATDFATRLQAVLDHVSGMTDVYALNLYRQLTGHTLPAV